MTLRTVPFDYGFFYHAMIALLGREPDSKVQLGWDGYYTFRYEPRDQAEERVFAEAIATLQRWLGIFELIPIRSRCEFGLLPHPRDDEQGKKFLYIDISIPVEKAPEKR